MKRDDFHKLFKTTGSVVLPVIHVLDNKQAERNVRIAVAEGAQGVFLINHDFGVESFVPIIRYIREAFSSLWLGVNFLAVTGKDAFPALANLQNDGCQIDAYWGDDARIDENASTQTEAKEISSIRNECGWQGLYFGGTAFKKQREVAPENYLTSAKLACGFMDVVTTSGIATGHAADNNKINDFRTGCGDTALALASGVTPENAHEYAQQVDAFLVATGINKKDDFYNIDADKLRQLLQTCRQLSLINQ